MSRSLFFCAALLLVSVSSLAFAAEPPKAIRTNVQAKVCGMLASNFSEKGACYVYDMQENNKFLRIQIAAGIRVNRKVLGFGGTFKSMIEATVDFPIGTDKKAAMEVAKNELEKKLVSKEVMSEIEKIEGSYSKVNAIDDLLDATDDEGRVKAIQKLLDSSN